MLVLGLTARLLLAAVFAIAGVAKLRQRAQLRQTLLAFAIPAALAPTIAAVLPLLELLLAATLLPPRTAPLAVLGALLLLAVFTAAIARSLQRGARPTCQCFGALSAEPIGVDTSRTSRAGRQRTASTSRSCCSGDAWRGGPRTRPTRPSWC